MATVSHLLVLIEGDAKSLNLALAQGTAATKGFETATTNASKSSATAFARIKTSAATSLGTAVPLGAGLAIAAVGAFAVSTVNAASDQEEALNKVRVVFGDTAASVEEFASSAADNFGLSETAALSAAAGFGTMLKSAGFAAEEIGVLSTDLVALAGDLASFNNIDVDEALLKLRSGLAGEAEPLRQLGVFLSEAKVQAEAFSSGIADVGSELTEAQKVQARYNIILEETGLAQGDFARTSDSLANQQRILAAEFENVKAEVGQALIPIVKDFIEVLSDLVPAIEAVGPVLTVVLAPLNLLGTALEQVTGDAAEAEEKLLEIAQDEFGSHIASQIEEARRGVDGLFHALADPTGAGVFIEEATAAFTAQREELGRLGVTNEEYERILDDNLDLLNRNRASIGDVTSAVRDQATELFLTRDAAGVYASAHEQATEATDALGDASDETTQSLKDQRAAVMALRDPFLGLVQTAKDAAAAQDEVNRLERQGKTDTDAYSDAVLDALTAQLQLKNEVMAYAQELRDSGASVREVKDSLLDMAESMGISKQEFKEAIGPIGSVLDKLKGINALPKTQEFDVVLTYHTVGTVPHGIAGGGVVKAAHGMITQGPTILAGEGTYSTFAGRGAEAIIPLNERGIDILGEAMERAQASWSRNRGGDGTITITMDRRKPAEELAREDRYRGWR